MNKPQVLVCQHGARHRYAIPRMLEEAGMLTALYTDSSAHSFLGKLAKMPGPFAPSLLRRLSFRQIKGIPEDKIYSSDRMYLVEFLQRLSGRLPFGMHLYRQRHANLSKRMKSWGLHDADVIYSMYHENLDFVRWAKAQGLKSVVDVFINPLTGQIVQEEYERFQDWGGRQNEAEIKLTQKIWADTAELSDILLCPSEFVAEGVQLCSPQSAHKIRIVPYGCSIDYHGRENNPTRGRVLFAGGDALRKGLHYLGKAASQLKNELSELDVRVAGAHPEYVVNHPVCTDLHFLGKLTSAQMQDEYLLADCFVLPSLAEGFAGVVAEALGAGAPVIVTKEAGSPVIHEREGLVTSSGDPLAIAAAIKRLILDRNFRDECGRESLAQSFFYSEEAWAKRLIEVINNL